MPGLVHAEKWESFPTLLIRDAFFAFLIDFLGDYSRFILPPSDDLSADTYRTFQEEFNITGALFVCCYFLFCAQWMYGDSAWIHWRILFDLVCFIEYIWFLVSLHTHTLFHLYPITRLPGGLWPEQPCIHRISLGDTDVLYIAAATRRGAHGRAGLLWKSW